MNKLKPEIIDDIVVFNHTLKFELGPRTKFAKSSFVTLHEHNMVEWEIVIDRRSQSRFFNLSTEPSNNSFHVRLQETGWREIFPDPKSIQFHLNVYDEDGYPYINPLKYEINGPARQELTFANRRVYSTEVSSVFGQMLTRIFSDDEFYELTFELCTTIQYTKHDLLCTQSLNSSEADPVPVELDYTFDSITNPERFNFKLLANNRRFVRVNKEMLYIASEYFRDHLTSNMTELVQDTDIIESLDIVVTYMITGKYKAPAQMSPDLAKDMITLANRYKVMNPKLFRNTVERHCYEEIHTHSDNINFVVKMMIMAQEKSLANLMNSCIACILSNHLNQFLDEYVHGNNPLQERIVTRRAVFSPSLAMLVRKGFALHSDVRSFTRQLPNYVEH